MANDTPESEFSIECFQNYTAPEVFVQGLAGMVDQTDVETIIKAQKHMLQRFEKTTEMLTNCNQLSATRLRAASTEFKKHTQLLLDMKKDLDFIFKKIRAIKTKLSTQYPEAYQAAVTAQQRPSIEEDDEQPSCSTTSSTKLVATASTETLRPVCDDKKITEDASTASTSSDPQKIPEAKPPKKPGHSSSSETESASSGDEASTDTG